jgi:predicted small lipoprotein YifL
MRWLLVGIVVTLQAASCGQKGPLYLPEDGDGARLVLTAAQDADARRAQR